MGFTLFGHYFNVADAITLCCGLGFTLFGYDSAMFSGILTNDYFLAKFNNPGSTLQAHITATFDLGCFFGALFTLWVGNRRGRKTMIMIGCLIHTLGGVLQCSAFSVEHLIVGRAVAGIGNGFITVTIPIWQSETCEAFIRGRLMAIQLSIVTGGGALASWINFAMRYVNSDASWRFVMAFQCVFALSCFSMVPFLPESPRWLVSKRRNEEAQKVIAQLLSLPIDDEKVVAEQVDIQIHVEHEEELQRTMKWRDLFKDDKLQGLKRILLGAGSQLFQQFGGINVILYYLASVFQNSIGMSHTMALILSGVNSINLFLSACVSSLFVDTFGRKKMMFYGYFTQGICYTMVAVGLGIGTTNSSKLAVAFMFIYYTSFGLTNNVTAWVYPAEIGSQVHRTLVAGTATATNWISNYIVVLITPIGIANIGWRFYIIFAVFNFSFLPLIYFYYVETARFTLEQIDEIFEEDYCRRKGIEYFPRSRISDTTVEKDEPETIEHEMVEKMV
ncbi:general substrate transporter [Limtongia smithiae]|uniref:general substrate transporter n=1 Tax=Limtongia smithiae TaxID=1125753 RepID=UPI0034CDAA8F